MKPQHQHDCEGCVFLGRLGKGDLYYHSYEPHQEYTSYLVRFSSEVPDYSSTADFNNRVLEGVKREIVGGEEWFYRLQVLFRVLGTELGNLVEKGE